MTIKEFTDGWKHFCNCIDFDHSALDSEAIVFMNEMPAAVVEGLTPNANAPDAVPVETPGAETDLSQEQKNLNPPTPDEQPAPQPQPFKSP